MGWTLCYWACTDSKQLIVNPHKTKKESKLKKTLLKKSVNIKLGTHR